MAYTPVELRHVSFKRGLFGYQCSPVDRTIEEVVDSFEIVWREGGDPRAIVEARGLRQVTDTGAIEKVIDAIIAENPDKAEQARGKPQLAGWFVGQVMKASGGKANPQAVNDLLKARLGI